MTARGPSRAAELRSRLNHPLIDGDSHIVEFTQVFLDYLKQAGGSAAVERFGGGARRGRKNWYQMTWDERRRERVMRPPWVRAIMSFDLGHWDVTDMTEPAAEAYELVEEELITSEDFRRFAFGHAVQLYAAPNPDFFKGTILEKEVAEELAMTGS